MSSFDELWHFVFTRRGGQIVQIREELEHVFNLISGCKTYLEVGSAEGDSMFVLSHALTHPSVTYVDWGEKHTKPWRDEVVKIMQDQKMNVRAVLGDSHSHDIVRDASILAPFDVVMIDAGHLRNDVVADAMVYGCLAKKFILFHDIMLPEVNAAFDWYVEQQGYRNVSKFAVKDSTFGYGVVAL